MTQIDTPPTASQRCPVPRRGRWLMLGAVGALLAVLILSSYWMGHPPAPYEAFSAESMATTVTAVIPSGPDAPESAETVFALFDDIDRRMSEWKDGSALAEVNRRAGDAPVTVPEDLLGLIRRGIDIGRRTDGAFDITWAALWGLWDFTAQHPRVPDAEAIASRTRRIGYDRIVVDEARGTVFLPEAGMKIGIGGIGKGYALARATAALRERGRESFMLIAGGQVYAAGLRDGRPWRVGVRDPRGEPTDYFAVLELTDESASTSGDYERFFETDGVRYHHILDPRTGWPAPGIRSVTVVSSDAVLADATSTALFVLGVEAGLRLAEQWDEIEAIVVDEHGRVRMTTGLEGRVQILHEPKR